MGADRYAAVAADSRGVWAVCGEAGARGGRLTRIDPTSNRVVATIRLASSTADPGGDIVVTNDSVWVSNPATATVRRIDSRRNQVTDDGWEADGSDLTLAADGVVWATSDIWLLGLGGPDVRGPRRNLHELQLTRPSRHASALWTGSEAGGAGAVGWAICVVEDLGGGAAVSSSQPPSPY